LYSRNTAISAFIPIFGIFVLLQRAFGLLQDISKALILAGNTAKGDSNACQPDRASGVEDGQFR
jgi:hypothetical protein